MNSEAAELPRPMLLSIIIPAYNEESVVAEAISAITSVLTSNHYLYEIIVVNDGSSDLTAQILSDLASQDARVKLITFSRNFGHQIAITAGLDFATGNAMIIMDADLQDPPSVLKDMIDMYQRGYDVVLAQRVSRSGEGVFKRATAAGFYWFMRSFVHSRLVSEVGDFQLLSRRTVAAINEFREEHRFMRGIVAWLGLKPAIVKFNRPQRHAGKTKYGIRQMLRLASTAIVSFTGFPAKCGMLLGVACIAVGIFAVMSDVCYCPVGERRIVVGSWIIGVHSVLAGVVLVAMGMHGEYVSRIYDEVRVRPLYVVSETRNIVLPHASRRRAIVLENRTCA